MKRVILLLFLSFSTVIWASNPLSHEARQFVKNSSWAFEVNKGQVKGQDAAFVKYFHKQGQRTMFLLESGIAYQFEKRVYPEDYRVDNNLSTKESKKKWEEQQMKIRVETYRMDIELVGANPRPRISAEGESEDYIQYYNHDALDVHAYQKITYHNIYPNIDWVIYLNSEERTRNKEERSTNYENQKSNNESLANSYLNLVTRIKYDFIVHPGGNPKDIKLKTKWVEELKINEDGSLLLGNRMGQVVENAPVSFQDGKEIKTRFSSQNQIIQFDVDAFDKSKLLIIDPTVIWATYYGGSSDDIGNASSIDSAGNVYLAGNTNSSNNIASGGFQTSYSGSSDAFLVKFSSSGSRIWATYYGGSASEYWMTCTADNSGNAYLAGRTYSTSGIASGGFQTTHGGGSEDAFLVKFSSTGTRLWATYYGGNNEEANISCATDTNNNVYLSGGTYSTNNIASSGFQNSLAGSTDAFLVKFSSSGSRLWGTYYGGTNFDEGANCIVDKNNNVILVGTTYSSSNVAASGFQNTIGGSSDAFLVSFSSSGSRLWATYYGGSDDDIGNSASSDTAGNIYLAGRTFSSSGIASGGFQNSMVGTSDAFLVKFTSSGSRSWATYYGGTNDDVASSSAVDSTGNIFLSGYTNSTTSIASNGLHTTVGGGWDAFLVKFTKTGSREWARYCGGSNSDYGYFLSHSKGLIYLAGYSNSSSNIASGGFQNSIGGNYDAFLIKLNTTIPLIQISTSGSDTICVGNSVTFTRAVYNQGTSPTYKWYKNQTGVSTDTIYTTSNLTDGDTIRCLLKSNAPGINIDSAWSNTIKIVVNPIQYKTVFDTICANKPRMIRGSPVSTSGTYFDTLKTTKGCDSFLTINLVVNSISKDTIYDTICANQSKLFNGIPRANSGIYLDTLANSKGCDSFLSLHLFVKAISTYTIGLTICNNDSILFKGKYLKTTGQYRDTLTNKNGCDSFVILNLLVKNTISTVLNDTICANQSRFFNGIYRTAAGTYFDTLTSLNSCDSFVTLNLFVRPIYTIQLFDTVCSNVPRLFNGVYRTSSGTYLDTLKTKFGCDSFITLNLMIKSISRDTIRDTICSNQSRLFNGVQRTSSGIYLDTLSNYKGCDSFIVLYLHVKPISSYTYSDTICFNDSTFFNGMFRNTSGQYRDTVANVKGCDSFVTFNLYIRPKISFQLFDTICANQTRYFNGLNRTVTGSYFDTLTSFKGCDSFVTLNLLVRPIYNIQLYDTVCSNSPRLFNGIYRSSSGSYLDTLKTIHGCDSFLTLNLLVNSISRDTLKDTACTNYPYFFNGALRNTTGIYLDTLKNKKGCDSFIYLHLMVNPIQLDTIQDTICANRFKFYNGQNLTSPGFYRDTFKNRFGCDSFEVLKLTVNNIYSTTLYDTICSNSPYFFNGNYLNTSGIYRDTLSTWNGCDSFIIVHLYVKQTSSIQLYDTICSNYPRYFNGQFLSTSGSFLDTLINSLGCDSFVTLHLLVKNTSFHTIYDTICVGIPRYFNGNVIFNSGLYFDTFINHRGCDSILTLNLHVKLISRHIIYDTICANKSYFFDGKILTTAGVYTATLTNHLGCDSFDILSLYVKPVIDTILYDSLCHGGSYFFDGKSLTQPGTYYDTLISSLGCDSFLTLNLIIKSKNIFQFYDTICSNQTYYFNGLNRTSSGIYHDTVKDSRGCDSFITLYLFIKSHTSSALNVTICNGSSYIFDAIPRTVAGTYTKVLKNKIGCDSIITLKLYIIYPTVDTIYKTNCPNIPYILNGKKIDSAGVYQATMKNQYGCDSSIILHLKYSSSKSLSVKKQKDSLIGTIGFIQYQWYNGEYILRGMTNSTLVTTTKGYYILKAYDADGCEYISDSIPIGNVSISNSSSLQLYVYPNPVHDIIYIQVQEPLWIDKHISINSMDGRRIKSQHLSKNQLIHSIDVKDLAAGSYIIQLESESKTKQFKFVKE